jgi:hypothetical protein
MYVPKFDQEKFPLRCQENKTDNTYIGTGCQTSMFVLVDLIIVQAEKHECRAGAQVSDFRHLLDVADVVAEPGQRFVVRLPLEEAKKLVHLGHDVGVLRHLENSRKSALPDKKQ